MTWKASIRRFFSRPLPGRAIPVLLVVIVGTAVVVPFFLSRYEFASGTKISLRLLSTHDLATIVAIMEEFDKGLRSGLLYPRWLPDINFGYGVATMVFYPPGIFYLGSLVHAVVKDWMTTVFVIAAGCSAASGLTLYWLSRLSYGRLASTVAALLYVALPYHALDLYWRGALPEFVGFAFLPVIFYFAYKLGSQGRLRHYAGLGLLYGLYVMTHLPVGYLLSYALGLCAVVWTVKSKDLAIGLRIACGMALGLLLSAAYWLPAAFEARHTLDVVTGIFPYHRSYITLQPGNNFFDDLVNSVFAYQALALLVALAVLRIIPCDAESRAVETRAQADRRRLWWKTLSKHSTDAAILPDSLTRLWGVMALAATFLSTSFSIYVSKLIPRIQIAVPAWRWLAIASVFVCLLVAAAIEVLISRPVIGGFKVWTLRAALAAAIALNLWLTVGSVIPKALANGNYARPANFVTTGFIPKDATYPDNLPVTSDVVIRPAGAIFEITRWDPQNRQIAIRVDEPSQLRLKTYYFPGWTAQIDGQRTTLSSDKDGVQLLSVPQGRHLIDVQFVDTVPRIAGKILFGLAMALIIGLATTDFVTRKNEWFEAKPLRESEEDTAAVPTRSNIRAILGGFVLAIMVIGGLTFALWHSPERGANQSGNNASASMAHGSEAALFVAGWDTIPVAASEKDLDELINAISTQDAGRVEELIQSGKAFRVKARCRIRILETRLGKANFRIIEGESITLDGWVPERWIK